MWSTKIIMKKKNYIFGRKHGVGEWIRTLDFNLCKVVLDNKNYKECLKSVARECQKYRLKIIIKKFGWGGRIRTYECRLQKPVPYRLATPQIMITP